MIVTVGLSPTFPLEDFIYDAAADSVTSDHDEGDVREADSFQALIESRAEAAYTAVKERFLSDAGNITIEFDTEQGTAKVIECAG